MGQVSRLDIQRAQRHAFQTLKTATGRIKSVKPQSISMPATIQQEVSLVNTTSNYRLEFGSDAPARTAVLNNIILGDNDIFVTYGIQILLGEGANANNRIYRSTGITPDDDSLYNGELKLKFESSEWVHTMSTRLFREEGEFFPYNGFQLINPQRIVTGRLATYEATLDLRDISGLTISGDLFIAVILHGAIGRP